MTVTLDRTRRTLVAAIAAGALASTACGSGGNEGGSGATGAAGADATGGAPTEVPFDRAERCYVDYSGDDGPPGEANIPDDAPRPGCAHEGELNLLPVGTVLRTAGADGDSSDDATLDVAYRAGYVERGQTGDPSNPASLRIVVALDVTPVGSTADAVEGQGFAGLDVVAHRGNSGRGQSTVDPCEGFPVPTATSPRTIYVEQGESYSTLHCFSVSGPESFLEGDPYVEVQGLAGDGSVPDSALLALPTERPDDLDEVLDDVAESIGRVADEAADPEERAGASWFERFRSSLDAPSDGGGTAGGEDGGDAVDPQLDGDVGEIDGGYYERDVTQGRGPFEGDPDVIIGEPGPGEDDLLGDEDDVTSDDSDSDGSGDGSSGGSTGGSTGGGGSNLPNPSPWRDK